MLSIDDPPRVSVIVPAFNAAATLRETLDAVAAQTYANLELLIVDDGSTDRTRAVAAAFCADEPRARLLTQPNGGVASARNLGVAHANGSLIAPLDADDIWHPDYLARCVAALIAADAGMAFAAFRLIDERSRVFGSSRSVAVDGFALRRMAFTNLVGNGSAMVVTRAALCAAGGYDARLRERGVQGCEDYLLQLRIAERHPIVAVPDHLVGYRVCAGSMSGDTERMTASIRAAIALFRAQATATVPDRVWRWHEASWSFRCALSRIRSGRVFAGIAAIVACCRLDIVGTAARLGDEALRLRARVADMLRGERDATSLPSFHSVDPSWLGTPPKHSLTDRVDRARLSRLAGSEATCRTP